MALFGARVVGDDGSDASGRRAVVRTLALPLSFLLLGLGFVGILPGGADADSLCAPCRDWPGGGVHVH